MADDVFGIVGTVQGGSFRVDQVVAEGGFAVVYRAYHGAFRSNVALKCLKIPRTLSDSDQKEFLEKFREEAELLFRLSSAIPSVVRPLHVGTLAHTKGVFVPFIALEWLEGRTLDSLVASRAVEGKPPLDPASVVKILTPVADALCRAHKFPGSNGGTVTIVHRDLKPENIFIASIHGKEVPKILDFGIAKVKSEANQMAGRQSSGESPMAAFTPAYGAPEQWSPKTLGQTGPWTDVWGLAITFVEAVCGHAPIDGDIPAMMGAAMNPTRRPTPRNEGVAVSDDVEAVLTQALAVDPRDRFHDIGAFWNALCSCLGLPQVVGDRSPSLAPAADLPDVSAALLPNARTVLAPKDAALPAGVDVPDLVVSAPARAPKEARKEGRPAQKPAPAAPKPAAPNPSAGLRAAALDPSSFYGGSTFEALAEDDLPPPSVQRDVLSVQRDAPLERRQPAGFAAARAVGHFAPPDPRQTGGRPKLEIAGPIKLLVLAVALMAGDYIYAASTGEILHFGPAKMVWLAGPIAGLGAVLLVTRLLAAVD